MIWIFFVFSYHGRFLIACLSSVLTVSCFSFLLMWMSTLRSCFVLLVWSSIVSFLSPIIMFMMMFSFAQIWSWSGAFILIFIFWCWLYDSVNLFDISIFCLLFSGYSRYSRSFIIIQDSLAFLKEWIFFWGLFFHFWIWLHWIIINTASKRS